MPTTCFDFITKKRRGDPPGVVAVFGDDEFLHRQARATIRDWVLDGEPSEFNFSTYTGSEAAKSPAAVLDDVCTAPFVGDRKLVAVEAADEFVTASRRLLEKFVQSPSPVGVLLLDVRSWSPTTNLSKLVELAVDCNSPRDWHVPGWCVKWAEFRHQKQIDQDTAKWLVEVVGAELGLLDQEIAKLALFVGEQPVIEKKHVDEIVAGSGGDVIFKIMDAALEGKVPEALRHLDNLVLSGQRADGVLPVISAQMRKLVEGGRRFLAGEPMDEALKTAGVHPGLIARATGHLRRLGRDRMVDMYRKLLSADLDLKGGSSLPARTLVERFLIDVGSGRGR